MIYLGIKKYSKLKQEDIPSTASSVTTSSLDKGDYNKWSESEKFIIVQNDAEQSIIIFKYTFAKLLFHSINKIF